MFMFFTISLKRSGENLSFNLLILLTHFTSCHKTSLQNNFGKHTPALLLPPTRSIDVFHCCRSHNALWFQPTEHGSVDMRSKRIHHPVLLDLSCNRVSVYFNLLEYKFRFLFVIWMVFVSQETATVRLGRMSITDTSKMSDGQNYLRLSCTTHSWQLKMRSANKKKNIKNTRKRETHKWHRGR
jgi:hypothetical protein